MTTRIVHYKDAASAPQSEQYLGRSAPIAGHTILSGRRICATGLSLSVRNLVHEHIHGRKATFVERPDYDDDLVLAAYIKQRAQAPID